MGTTVTTLSMVWLVIDRKQSRPEKGRNNSRLTRYRLVRYRTRVRRRKKDLFTNLFGAKMVSNGSWRIMAHWKKLHVYPPVGTGRYAWDPITKEMKRYSLHPNTASHSTSKNQKLVPVRPSRTLLQGTIDDPCNKILLLLRTPL